MDAPGKGILKVVSVLFIIFGAIATIFSILALTGSTWLSSNAGQIANQATGTIATALSGILVVSSIIMLIISVLALILGIVGVRKSDNPTSSNFFIVIGIILGILFLIAMIMNFNIFNLIGFILSVLYIIGGSMNKKEVART